SPGFRFAPFGELLSSADPRRAMDRASTPRRAAMYKAREFRLGRMFQVDFDPGDDYMAELERFVREKNIRFGSVFLLGALKETGMISGFNSMQGYDVARHTFNDWRELVAYGNISWPETPPAALGEGVVWT